MKSFWYVLVMLVATSAWAEPAGITSRAWVVIDQASGRELAAHQADLPLAPASLTQLMTAYVLLDDIKKNKISLGEMVTVPEAEIGRASCRERV